VTYALQLNGDKRDSIDGHLGDLLCPRCGFDCTHIDAVDVVTAGGNAVSVEADGWRIIRFAAKEVLNDPQKCFEETFWALRNARA